ncbi:hypothetical protein NUACC21_25540 [Scytonema sp. NUACC21]
MSGKTLLKSLLKRSSHKIVAFSLFSLGSFSIASPSFAASLDVGSWARSGDVSQTAGQATLTNASADGSDDVINYNVSGNNPSGISNLETFLGVSQGTLGLDATEGSAIQTALNVIAGDTFSFDWNFTTFDTRSIDRAFVTIGNSVFNLDGTSGRFSRTFDTPGTYNIGIGVIDVDDFTNSSRLTLSNANQEPVPEPLTILGSLTALGFGASLRRRFRKKA